MFGTQTTSTPSFFGTGFATTTQPQQTTSVFGSGFGQPATTPAPAFSGFGTTNPAAPATGATFGGFGQTTASTNTSFGGFSAPAAAQPSTGGFFSNINQSANSTSGFGGFGAPAAQPASTTWGNFGAQQTQPATTGFFGSQPQSHQQINSTVTPEGDYAARLAACVQNPVVFGDERDQILAKYNSTMATLGNGKAWYTTNLPPLDLNPENVFSKWKYIVFMPKPDSVDEDGVVRLIFGKSGDAVFEVQKELADLLHKLMGDRPNVQVVLDGVSPLPGAKSELMFHVVERLQDGSLRKVPATELSAFLTQPQQATNLKAMLVEDVQTKLMLTKDMEKEYLDKVPSGISPYAWHQAQKENPDSENLLPVPIIGFDQMYSLLKREDALAALSRDTCQQIGDEVKRLEKKVEENKQLASTYQDKLERYILRQLHISSSQPVVCRIGQPLTQFESSLAEHVGQLKTVMEGPEKNLKNRSQELTANIQLHDRFLSGRAKRQPRIDLKTLSANEQADMSKACELLVSVLDACKQKIQEEKELLTKLLYEESTGTS